MKKGLEIHLLVHVPDVDILLDRLLQSCIITKKSRVASCETSEYSNLFKFGMAVKWLHASSLSSI